MTGCSRTMRVGGKTVRFEPAPTTLIDVPNTPSGRVLQALHHLERERVNQEPLDQVNERYPVAELLHIPATPA